MAGKEFLAELVGWLGNEFKDRASLVLDAENASRYSGLAFEDADSVVRRLRFEFTTKKILSIEPFFDTEGASSEFSHATAQGVKQRDFVFRRGERFEKLSLFFSFSDGRQDRSQISPLFAAVDNAVRLTTRDIETPLHTGSDKPSEKSGIQFANGFRSWMVIIS